MRVTEVVEPGAPSEAAGVPETDSISTRNIIIVTVVAAVAVVLLIALGRYVALRSSPAVVIHASYSHSSLVGSHSKQQAGVFLLFISQTHSSHKSASHIS